MIIINKFIRAIELLSLPRYTIMEADNVAKFNEGNTMDVNILDELVERIIANFVFDIITEFPILVLPEF